MAAPRPARVGAYAPRRKPCGGLWTRSSRRLSPSAEAPWWPLDPFKSVSMPAIGSPVVASGPARVCVYALRREPCGGLWTRLSRRLYPSSNAPWRPLDPFVSVPLAVEPCGGLRTRSWRRPCPPKEAQWRPLGPLKSASMPIVGGPVACGLRTRSASMPVTERPVVASRIVQDGGHAHPLKPLKPLDLLKVASLPLASNPEVA